jgi:hypothetical protein
MQQTPAGSVISLIPTSHIMKPMKIFSATLLIAILIAALFFPGCKKDEDPAAPGLPSMELMMLDFSNFSDPSDTLNPTKSNAGYYNWGAAFLQASFWNTFITVGTAIPVASYIKALSQTPVYLGDNRWEWKYDIVAENKGFNVSLITERISNEEFTATMYVSLDAFGGFADFKLFDGTVRYDHTQATWTLYENPLFPTPLLRVEWNRDWEAGTGDLTYTNIRPGSNETGSFIHYSFDQDQEYDAAFTISFKSGTSVIEWNRETRAGRIMNSSIFGDDQWHCWNSNLQNIDCP